jgi:hypothetical protein
VSKKIKTKTKTKEEIAALGAKRDLCPFANTNSVD